MTRIQPRTRLSRRQVLSGAGGLLTGLTGSAVAASMLMRMDRQPSITMIGSGSAFSLLIAAGGARLIIVHGTDPADFGNALARARTTFLYRTDIAFVAHPTGSVNFVRTALDRIQPERTYAIGATNDLLDAGVRVDDSLRNPTEFRLPRNMTLTLPAIPVSNAGKPAWTATLTHDGRHVIISSGDHERLPPLLQPEPAAWIHLDGALSSEWIAQVRPGFVAMPAGSITGPGLREIESAIGYEPFRGIRVHAGEATRLELDELDIS